jgi:hypothetical protein
VTTRNLSSSVVAAGTDTAADDIARYETIPLDELQAELSAAGIDAQATVDAVMQIVSRHRAAARQPRNR